MFSRFTVVKDGVVTNQNSVQDGLRDVLIPENLLDLIYVGRCAEEEQSCSVHGGDITDVNLWNRALSLQEMIDWTSCK